MKSVSGADGRNVKVDFDRTRDLDVFGQWFGLEGDHIWPVAEQTVRFGACHQSWLLALMHRAGRMTKE